MIKHGFSKATIVGVEKFDFLSHLVENIADLPAVDSDMKKSRAPASGGTRGKRKTPVDGAVAETKKRRGSGSKKTAKVEETKSHGDDEAMSALAAAAEAASDHLMNSVDTEDNTSAPALPSFSKREISDDDEHNWEDE